MFDGSEAGERGFSLVGTILVLVILGGMATVVVASLPSGGGLDPVLGGSSAPPGASVSAGPPAPRPPSLIGSAAIAACQADERSIEEAVAAMHASTGSYPATVAEMVSGHWLTQSPNLAGFRFSLETTDGRPTGRVLVNGSAGVGGCSG
jgi:hypothetical protein